MEDSLQHHSLNKAKPVQIDVTDLYRDNEALYTLYYKDGNNYFNKIRKHNLRNIEPYSLPDHALGLATLD